MHKMKCDYSQVLKCYVNRSAKLRRYDRKAKEVVLPGSQHFKINVFFANNGVINHRAHQMIIRV